MLDKIIEEQFLGILQEELIPAMGCTEPIALAYAAAKAKEIIVEEPIKIIAKCSGNIIKNVRCVAIPNSNGRTGIEVAVALGAFGGQADLKMEVLDAVTQESIEKVDRFIQENKCEVCYLDSVLKMRIVQNCLLDICSVKQKEQVME